MAMENATLAGQLSRKGLQVANRSPDLDMAFRASVADLRPTQAAVGMRAVATKRARVERKASERKRLEKFLGKRPIPTVLGPGGELFMIDHHHLGLALWQADVDSAFVVVIEDLSVLPVAAFWSTMESQGRLYPFDEAGRRIAPSRLPSRLGGLREDIYRDLAWSVREAGGYHKVTQPYSEFEWADHFRVRITERTIVHDYDAAVKRAVRIARSNTSVGLPGYRPL